MMLGNCAVYVHQVLLFLVVRCINGLTPLPSVIYQPGAGIVIESWRTTQSYSFGTFSQIPDYPDCPNVIQNSNTFEYTEVHTHQHIRARAYFVSPQSGNHKFFAIFNNRLQLKIEHLPHDWKTIINSNSKTADNWNNRIDSTSINLVKGFRYMIEILYYGNGFNPEFFRLGVKFPDQTEVKPIDGSYLRRSMEFYEWKGLLAQRYESIVFPSQRTVAAFKSSNPTKYPANPSYYTCRSTLFDPEQYRDFGNYYALRYIGYFRPPNDGTFTFKMWCNEMCELMLTKNNVETSLGTFSIQSYSNPQSEIMNAGFLSAQTDYPIKAFTTERGGNDYIRVQYKIGSGSYGSSWVGKIRNLVQSETYCNIPAPVLTVINSTAISVSLVTLPSIPPRDNWASNPKYDVYYHKKGSEVPLYKILFTGSLPKTAAATGLLKYTEYSFYAYYYGLINSALDHHLIAKEIDLRTGEDVPDAPPQSLVATQQTSTSMKLRWGLLPSITSWNGIPLGYQIKYAIKDANPKNYGYVDISGSGNRQKIVTLLRKYTLYEFQIAGNTSKGAGVFSSVVEERTKEDVPSAAPVNVSSHNTSSTSISVQWKNVVPEHQNGIINQFKVYIRKSGSSSAWSIVSLPASQKSYLKNQLELWTFYDVKVSAETSVGEGPTSASVQARTDEDKPTGPPLGLTLRAVSSTAITAVWTSVSPSKTNGIIVGYAVSCQRTDKRDSLRSFITKNETITLTGLENYIDYDIGVAGMTKKGAGPVANGVQKTLEDAPSAAPTSLQGQNISSSAIRIHWNVIPVDDRNGIITGYNVSYRKSNSNDQYETRSVNATQLSLIASGLAQYQFYEFKIAGFTAVGMGPFSSLVNIRTDADAPTRPPANLTGHFINHTSIIVNWTYIPEGHRQGVVSGYKLMFKDGTLPNSSWTSHIISSKDDVNGFFNKTLANLKIYTPYIFKVAGFTYKALGVFSNDVTIWTDDYAPKEPPRNTSGVNSSSTEIVLDWTSMAEIHGDANGKVLGYIVRYQVVDCHEDHPAGCDESKVFTIKTTDPNSTINIPQLRKFTEYSLRVKVYNRKGEGNFSSPILVKTDEDKPDAPPTIVETWPGTSESLVVFWSPIPESLRNGIILSYRIFYKPIDEPLHKYSRAPRSVNPFAAFAALPGEKMVEVNASMYHVEIADLKDYSWYQVRIGAVTSKGLGVTFSMNGTCKQLSPIAAPDLEITDKYDFHEISLKWNEISNASARGEVLGYRISYWPIERDDVAVASFKAISVNVLAPNRSLIIKNLTPYTTYAITISAFTEGGYGVLSRYKPGETCRCPRILYSSRMLLPPLVDGVQTAVGILPKYVEGAVQTCCGNCSGGHGLSYVDWAQDATKSSSVKYDMQAVINSIDAGTQITVPFFKDKFDEGGGALHTYVAFVPSPGVAIFQRKPTKRELGNKGAVIMKGSIFQQYPLLLIMLLFTILAGMVYWYLEKDTNTEEIPPEFIRGTGSGFWLAYITMTTVGYGDITPVTKLARIFTLGWSLLGIILVGMIVGGIAETLSWEILYSSSSIKVDGKMLASNETFMLAIKDLKAKTVIGNTSDPYFVRNALISGDVAGAVLDVLKAAQHRDVLEHPDIEFKALKKLDASYGVVLAGEGRRIRHCVARYARENSQQILMELSNYSLTFEQPEAGKLELLDYMISHHADLTSWTIKYSGIVLAILIGLGSVYELMKWIRGRAKVEGNLKESEMALGDITENIENMVDKIQDTVNKLEMKHAQERLQLTKMGMSYVTELYPSLSIFDHTIPSQKKYARTKSQNNVMDAADDEEDDNSSENMDLDMAMNRKSSWAKLR